MKRAGIGTRSRAIVALVTLFLMLGGSAYAALIDNDTGGGHPDRPRQGRAPDGQSGDVFRPGAAGPFVLVDDEHRRIARSDPLTVSAGSRG